MQAYHQKRLSNIDEKCQKVDQQVKLNEEQDYYRIPTPKYQPQLPIRQQGERSPIRNQIKKRMDSSEGRMKRYLASITQEQGMLLDNCTANQYSKKQKNTTYHLFKNKINEEFCKERYNYQMEDSLYDPKQLQNKCNSKRRAFNSNITAKMLNQSLDNDDQSQLTSDKKLSKLLSLSLEDPIKKESLSNLIIEPKKDITSTQKVLSNTSSMDSPTYVLHKQNTSLYQNEEIKDTLSGQLSSITFQKRSTNQKLQPSLILPKARIVVLDIIDNQPAMAKSEIEFSMEDYWLKLISPRAQEIVDCELLGMVQPYMKEFLTSEKYQKQQNKLKVLSECNKWRFLNEIQKYERGELPQNTFEELLIYFFGFGNAAHRKKVISDLINHIQQEIWQQYPKQQIMINSIVDINGRQVTELFQLQPMIPLLIVGTITKIKVAYPCFKVELQEIYNQLKLLNDKNSSFKKQEIFTVRQSASHSPSQKINQVQLPKVSLNIQMKVTKSKNV